MFGDRMVGVALAFAVLQLGGSASDVGWGPRRTSGPADRLPVDRRCRRRPDVAPRCTRECRSRTAGQPGTPRRVARPRAAERARDRPAGRGHRRGRRIRRAGHHRPDARDRRARAARRRERPARHRVLGRRARRPGAVGCARRGRRPRLGTRHRRADVRPQRVAADRAEAPRRSPPRRRRDLLRRSAPRLGCLPIAALAVDFRDLGVGGQPPVRRLQGARPGHRPPRSRGRRDVGCARLGDGSRDGGGRDPRAPLEAEAADARHRRDQPAVRRPACGARRHPDGAADRARMPWRRPGADVRKHDLGDDGPASRPARGALARQLLRLVRIACPRPDRAGDLGPDRGRDRHRGFAVDRVRLLVAGALALLAVPEVRQLPAFPPERNPERPAALSTVGA